MDTLFIYKFEDGTELLLVNQGFSMEELWKMREIHGKATVSFKNVQIVYR